MILGAPAVRGPVHLRALPLGRDGAGHDAVDADAQGPELLALGARQAHQGGFAGGVEHGGGVGDAPGDGAEVDDAAGVGLGVGTGAGHAGEEGLGEEEDVAEVGVDVGVECRRGDLRGWLARDGPGGRGVVDEDVDGVVVLGKDVGGGGLQGWEVGEVAGVELGDLDGRVGGVGRLSFVGERGEAVDEGLGRGGVDVDEEDFAALVGEEFDGGGADALGSPCHKDSFVAEAMVDCWPGGHGRRR